VAAAAAGEVAKDEKHLATVEFAFKTLCTIADHTTPVHCNLARKNLLQKLSVALWMNNARLRYWALQGISMTILALFP